MKDFSEKDIEAAIFDLDGTLVDSMGHWQRMGITYLTLKNVQPEENLIEILYPLTIIQIAEYLKTRYGLSGDCQTIIKECNDVMETAYSSDIFLKSGVKEFLDILVNKNIPLYVATATDRHLVEIVLNRLNIAHYFKGIITSTEAGSAKAESPAIFDIARERLGSPRNKTVIFEDSLHAIETAAKAGYPIAAVYDDAAKADTDCIKNLSEWYAETFDEYVAAFTAKK
ncbi:MAG: HAD family phosphatase [Spirochaetales bacterium]